MFNQWYAHNNVNYNDMTSIVTSMINVNNNDNHSKGTDMLRNRVGLRINCSVFTDKHIIMIITRHNCLLLLIMIIMFVINITLVITCLLMFLFLTLLLASMIDYYK